MGLGTSNKVKIEGGMASMTDLVFLLLIFFIIMSLMSNQNTRVDVPETSENLPPIQDPTEATVVVTEDNLYVVFPGGDMNNPRPFDEIRGDAEAAVVNSGKMKLKIEGHRKADYEAVFHVMALAQVNGWDPVLSYKK